MISWEATTQHMTDSNARKYLVTSRTLLIYLQVLVRTMSSLKRPGNGTVQVILPNIYEYFNVFCEEDRNDKRIVSSTTT